MAEELEKLHDEFYKVFDLVRALSDTIENCRRTQRHPVHADTLIEILYKQCHKSVLMLDEYYESQHDG